MSKNQVKKETEEKNYNNQIDDEVIDECEKILHSIFNSRKAK